MIGAATLAELTGWALIAGAVLVLAVALPMIGDGYTRRCVREYVRSWRRR